MVELSIQQTEDLSRTRSASEIIKFEGVVDCDTYNITAPFTSNEELVIAARVEPNDLSSKSNVKFFKRNPNGWTLASSLPSFDLEDPFVTKINDQLVFGGVETYPISKDSEFLTRYKTVFYRGKDLQSLEKFAKGPDMMKDIRLFKLQDGRIGVFTRPQGGLNERGRIGFTTVEHLDELSKDNIERARVLEGQFQDGFWGGVNQAQAIDKNRIGVLGHIAYEDSQGKHYFAMTFVLNPQTLATSPLEIIATRADFPPGKTRHEKLKDVVFPGGILINPDMSATLYAGLSDKESGLIRIKYPWELIN